MRLVIIPNSGTIPAEMNAEFGERLPAYLPFLGKKVLDKIIELYTPNKDIHFVVTVRDNLVPVGYEGVQFVNEIPHQLGVSVYRALLAQKEHPSCIVINFGDTLVTDVAFEESNIVYYVRMNESYRWTTFEAKENKIVTIHDKWTHLDHKKANVFVGVFVIKDSLLFQDELRKQIEMSSKDIFYNALYAYLQKVSYRIVETNCWFDFGHIDTYYQAKKKYLNTRFFNRLHINSTMPVIEKRSNDLDKFKGEIEWYVRLPTQLRPYIPQVFSYSTDPVDMYVQLEYYGYPPLADLFSYAYDDKELWYKVITAILACMKTFYEFKIEESPVKIREALTSMYVTKTLLRLAKVKNQFPQFFGKQIKINGINYECLSRYTEIIPEVFQKITATIPKYFTIIHGDLCLSNILYDKKTNIIKLIDPRGSFGSFNIYGDLHYDVAKLVHSFDGRYEHIISDAFTVTTTSSEIRYKFTVEHNEALSDILYAQLGQLPIVSFLYVQFIEAMLFLSMVPLHEDHPSRQLVMLAQGVEKFDRIRREFQ